MQLTREEELDLSRQFGFYVIEKEDRLEVVSYFHIRRQDNWGVVLIILLTLVPIYHMIYNDDLVVRITCGVVGVGLGGFALLGLIKMMTDELVITKDRITFRNSLVHQTIQLEPGMEVKMRTETGVIRRRYPYLLVELWLKKGTGEQRIFDFVSHQKDRVLMERLAKQLKATINRRLP